MRAQTLKKRGSTLKKKKTIYLFALLLAGVLFCYSIYGGAPQVLLVNTSAMFAQTIIGASASVQPNAYNSAAEQIKAKEAELADRERELADREKARTSEPARAGDVPLYSFAISFGLLLLVGMNFYFDWRRSRGMPANIPLRTINLKR